VFDANALPPLREVVGRFDIAAQKSLGQHFLFDLNLTRRVVSVAGDLSGINVVEIGAGPGGLTRALLESNARHVYAIERDARAVAALRELAEHASGRLTIVDADALSLDLSGVSPPPRRVIANLPYNIGTQLLINWLTRAEDFLGFTLMFQKEVAERITAQPGDSAFGRLSILTGWMADSAILFDIPPEAFVPAPKITSSVVHIRPLAAPRYPCDRAALEHVTRLAFGQRRKMLRASLKPIGGEALLTRAGIDPQCRPQDLDIAAFCHLAREVGPSLESQSPSA
jgi:16S rRNA (adenine1518-N6/adenine1519-N6)-dimethyltransferase